MPPVLPPPPVTRAIYRCLLRASRFGRFPEVFGPFGASVIALENNSDDTSLSSRFPSSPKEVRQLLHHTFTSVDDTKFNNQDPFEAVRFANQAAATLCPSSLPSRLPIFDFSSSAALPGEQVPFNFFEPRYLKLVDLAVENDGYFLLRVGNPPRGGASLLRIVHHAPLPGGTVGVQCVAGPRVGILGEEILEIAAEKEGDALPLPLAVTTMFEVLFEDTDQVAFWLVDDKDHDTVAKNEELDWLALARQRAKILDLLSTFHLASTIQKVGLPPIDPTAFSFWALRFMLGESDVASRQRWLYRCQDAGIRMDYVQDFLESMIERRRMNDTT